MRIGFVVHGDSAIQLGMEWCPAGRLPMIAQRKSEDPAWRVRRPARPRPRARTRRNLRTIRDPHGAWRFFRGLRPRTPQARQHHAATPRHLAQRAKACRTLAREGLGGDLGKGAPDASMVAMVTNRSLGDHGSFARLIGHFPVGHCDPVDVRRLGKHGVIDERISADLF
jgi:hypothetical protein